MLALSGVEDHAVLLLGLDVEGQVDGGGGEEGVQLDVSRGGDQLDRDEVLASLPW